MAKKKKETTQEEKIAALPKEFIDLVARALKTPPIKRKDLKKKKK